MVQVTKSKIVALAICLFTLAAVADTRPGPAVARRADAIHVSTVLHARGSLHARGNHLWACPPPVPVEAEPAPTFVGVAASEPLAPIRISLTLSSPRAPPRG
jgi:hypothetical protein